MKKYYIGAASDLGVHVNGASLAPEILLIDKKEHASFIKQDKAIIKSLAKEDLAKNYKPLYEVLNNVYHSVLDVDNDSFVSMIGGDHSMAIPSALASTKRNGKLGLIWIDAHTDYHTMTSTVSGNLHGLPCAAINDFGARDLSLYHDGEYIDDENTVIIGARSIDDGEYENLKHTKVRVYTIEEVKERGIKAIFDEAFNIALNGTNGIHLSYDLDFLDPGIAPGVSTPVLNGGTMEMFEEIQEYLIKHRNKIKSFDLVEFNPLNDIDEKTKKLALRILNECDF